MSFTDVGDPVQMLWEIHDGQTFWGYQAESVLRGNTKIFHLSCSENFPKKRRSLSSSFKLHKTIVVSQAKYVSARV